MPLLPALWIQRQADLLFLQQPGLQTIINLRNDEQEEHQKAQSILTYIMKTMNNCIVMIPPVIGGRVLNMMF